MVQRAFRHIAIFSDDWALTFGAIWHVTKCYIRSTRLDVLDLLRFTDKALASKTKSQKMTPRL